MAGKQILDRRAFLSSAAASIAAAELGGAQFAQAAQPRMSFASVKHISAGLLNIGYADAGSEHGSAVILLHG